MQPARSPKDEIEGLASFLASEGIAPGARILDVPCGLGRRALMLAELGFEVTGVDANAVALDVVRGHVPPDLSGRLQFHVADASSYPGLPADRRFDSILCLDHALGRGPREQDVAFLERLAAHLRPDGVLIADFLCRDFFAVRPRPFAFHVLGTMEQHEFRTFDALRGELELQWKLYEREGDDLRHRADSTVRLRLLAPHEVRTLLEDAGWTMDGPFGGWGREPVTADRRKIILIARRGARVK